MPDWKQYWERRQYISGGRTRISLQWDGYDDQEFQYLAGDVAKLHPQHWDHVYVPSFQCVTHECRYHFQGKFDSDHFPERKSLDDGTPAPVTWTYNHGVGAASMLWETHVLDTWRRTQPRGAWPAGCTHAHYPHKHQLLRGTILLATPGT